MDAQDPAAIANYLRAVEEARAASVALRDAARAKDGESVGRETARLRKAIAALRAAGRGLVGRVP